MLRTSLFAAALLGGFLLPGGGTGGAYAHGPAKWVQDGQYKNAVGELCCGENDCGMQSAGTIVRVHGGYEVEASFEGINRAGDKFAFPVKGFVKDQDATPSPTGDYWACSWGGKLRCFFAPLPGS
jgi:hypothetical protein